MESPSYQVDHTQRPLASITRNYKVDNGILTRERTTEFYVPELYVHPFERVSSDKADEDVRSQVPFEGTAQQLSTLFNNINKKVFDICKMTVGRGNKAPPFKVKADIFVSVARRSALSSLPFIPGLYNALAVMQEDDSFTIFRHHGASTARLAMEELLRDLQLKFSLLLQDPRPSITEHYTFLEEPLQNTIAELEGWEVPQPSQTVTHAQELPQRDFVQSEVSRHNDFQTESSHLGQHGDQHQQAQALIQQNFTPIQAPWDNGLSMTTTHSDQDAQVWHMQQQVSSVGLNEQQAQMTGFDLYQPDFAGFAAPSQSTDGGELQFNPPNH